MNTFNKRLIFIIMKNLAITLLIFLVYKNIPRSREWIAYVLMGLVFLGFIGIDVENWKQDQEADMMRILKQLRDKVNRGS